MLRLIPTAMHSLEDVQYTIDSFKAVKEKLDSGYFAQMEFNQNVAD
jgi:glycine C-acetyltransferase